MTMDTFDYSNQPTFPLDSCHSEHVRPVNVTQQNAGFNAAASDSSKDSSGKGGNDDLNIPNSFVQVRYEDLHFMECCGEGSFGSVYRALWLPQGKQEVAVKKIHHMDKEAHVLSVLSHRNIIQFYGACAEAPNFCIVTEFAPYGSLFDFLSTSESDKLEFPQLVSWSRDIALGMNYLHDEAPVTVIHRDLKSKNVVICRDFTLKICDFGASRFFSETIVMTVTGTYPWMAPELIQGLPTSELCDVYSFGVVLWELLTREVPFKGLQGFQVAWAVVENRERPPLPDQCPKRFSELIEKCWSGDTESRPTFQEILVELNEMLNDDQLVDDTNAFLGRKEDWIRDLDEKREALRSQEEELGRRKEQLDERERKVKEWEEKLREQMRKQKLVGVARYKKTSENLKCKISGTGEGAIESVKDVLSHIMSKSGANRNGQKATSSNFGSRISDAGPLSDPFVKPMLPMRSMSRQDSLSSLASSGSGNSRIGASSLFPAKRSPPGGSPDASIPRTSPVFSRMGRGSGKEPRIESDIDFKNSTTSKTMDLFSQQPNAFSDFTGNRPSASEIPSSDPKGGSSGRPRTKMQKQVSSSSEEYNFEGAKVSRCTSVGEGSADGGGVRMREPEVETWETAKGDAKVNRTDQSYEMEVDDDIRDFPRPPPPSMRRLKPHNSSPCLFANLPSAVEPKGPSPDATEQDIRAAVDLMRQQGVELAESFAQTFVKAFRKVRDAGKTPNKLSLPDSHLQAKLPGALKYKLLQRHPTTEGKCVVETKNNFSSRQSHQENSSTTTTTQSSQGGAMVKRENERRSGRRKSVSQRSENVSVGNFEGVAGPGFAETGSVTSPIGSPKKAEVVDKSVSAVAKVAEKSAQASFKIACPQCACKETKHATSQTPPPNDAAASGKGKVRGHAEPPACANNVPARSPTPNGSRTGKTPQRKSKKYSGKTKLPESRKIASPDSRSDLTGVGFGNRKPLHSPEMAVGPKPKVGVRERETVTETISESGFYRGGFLRNRRSVLPSYYRRYFSDSGLDEQRSKLDSSDAGITIPTAVEGIYPDGDGVFPSRDTDAPVERRGPLFKRSLSTPEAPKSPLYDFSGALPSRRPTGKSRALDSGKPPLPDDDVIIDDIMFRRSSTTSPSAVVPPPSSTDSGCDDGRASGSVSPCLSDPHPLFFARVDRRGSRDVPQPIALSPTPSIRPHGRRFGLTEMPNLSKIPVEIAPTPSKSPIQERFSPPHFVTGTRMTLSSPRTSSPMTTRHPSLHLHQRPASADQEADSSTSRRVSLPCRFLTQKQLSSTPRNSWMRDGGLGDGSSSISPTPQLSGIRKQPPLERDIIETDDFTYIIRPRGRRVT